jgi:hypothetical protein
MSYYDAARLASKGRGGDTTLVHMSPGEVKSLQDLAMAHGGSLTVNPSTGLPEAGFLSSILPMVAGAALMATGVGAPMAAMLVGGGTALATGDIRKGISAGLGAYGGAGLGAGLMSAGTQAAADAAVAGNLSALGEPALAATNAAQAAQATPFSTMGQGLSSIASTGAEGEAARSAFMGKVGGLGGLARTGLAAAAPAIMAPTTPQPPLSSTTTPMNRLEYQARSVSPTPMPDVPGYGDLGRDFGRQQRYFDGRFVDTGRKFVPGDFGGTTTPMPMADGGSVPSYEQMSSGQDFGYQMQPQAQLETYTPRDIPGAQAKFAYESTPLAVSGAGYVPGYGDQGQDFGQQQQYFVRQFRELTPPPPQPVAPSDSGSPVYYGTDGYFAKGGISHLGDYSDGGRMLRGPGDGVSDSIPATIGGKQPARLADGEFVVPARIVSELGNGSSEAGARKLYAMMDRIQNARGKTVGKKRVAVDSKAEKLLPA